MKFREAAKIAGPGLTGIRIALLILADQISVKDLSGLTFEQCRKLYTDEKVTGSAARQLLAARIRELAPETHPAEILALGIRLTKHQLLLSLKKAVSNAEDVDDWLDLYGPSRGTSYRRMVEREIRDLIPNSHRPRLVKIYKRSEPGSKIEKAAEEALLMNAKSIHTRVSNLELSRDRGALRSQTLEQIHSTATSADWYFILYSLKEDRRPWIAQLRKKAVELTLEHSKNYFALLEVWENNRPEEDSRRIALLQRMHDADKKNKQVQDSFTRLLWANGYTLEDIGRAEAPV